MGDSRKYPYHTTDGFKDFRRGGKVHDYGILRALGGIVMKQYLGLYLSYGSFVKTPRQGHSCFEANRGTCLSLLFSCFFFSFQRRKVNTNEKNLTVDIPTVILATALPSHIWHNSETLLIF